jgi:cysteine-S-conjugate beta-lyase
MTIAPGEAVGSDAHIRRKTGRESTSDGFDTLVTRSGRSPEEHHGAANVPVYRASTILFPSVAAGEAAFRNRYDQLTYGRIGTPTSHAFEDAMAEVEGGYRAVAFPSGAAACFTSLLAFTKLGDHVLVPDSVYPPMRDFCDKVLPRFGVSRTFYDPLVGADIGALIRKNTSAIYLESPGSHTFEVQDVPAIVGVAKAHGITTLIDNTWGAPLFFKPMAVGVDVTIIAATKYIVGHSDAILGIAVCTEKSFMPVRETATLFGNHAAPDDCYLALRGLRTAAVRLRRHETQALALARWLDDRPEVVRVLHPALPSCPGHDIWRRDFAGSSGLFGVVLQPGTPKAAIDTMLDGMKVFGLGFSWGGVESLIVPVRPVRICSSETAGAGPLLRLHAGLEDLEGLIDDLESGFARLAAAC